MSPDSQFRKPAHRREMADSAEADAEAVHSPVGTGSGLDLGGGCAVRSVQTWETWS